MPYLWEVRKKSRKRGSKHEPESLSKLHSFLEGQNSWLQAFVEETDETRFQDVDPDEDDMDVSDSDEGGAVEENA